MFLPMVRKFIACCLFLSIPFSSGLKAQELQAKVTINHAQIQGTDVSVFESLQQTMEQFLNDQQWTALQFQKNERIVCNFNITVSKYDQSNNSFHLHGPHSSKPSGVQFQLYHHLI